MLISKHSSSNWHSSSSDSKGALAASKPSEKDETTGFAHVSSYDQNLQIPVNQMWKPNCPMLNLVQRLNVFRCINETSPNPNPNTPSNFRHIFGTYQATVIYWDANRLWNPDYLITNALCSQTSSHWEMFQEKQTPLIG
jgi:hypothetical protein